MLGLDSLPSAKLYLCRCAWVLEVSAHRSSPCQSLGNVMSRLEFIFGYVGVMNRATERQNARQQAPASLRWLR